MPRTKKTTEKVEKTSSAKANRGLVLKNPRITEKATMLAEFNAYTFDIDPRSNKSEVVKAIKTLYKVSPVKIRTVIVKSKNVFRRGTKGKTTGGKKAIVYLKKEDKIELI